MPVLAKLIRTAEVSGNWCDHRGTGSACRAGYSGEYDGTCGDQLVDTVHLCSSLVVNCKQKLLAQLPGG